MSIELKFEFRSKFQEDIFNSTKRHICGSGGYGNGKTYAGCMKILVLAGTFPKYRSIIGRLKSTDLRKTTMTTFYKVCPPDLYDEKKGGRRVDSASYLKLINGSEIFFMHFDDYDEGSVRGLEVNSVLLDQAEEIGENIFLHLDARVGRWDAAEVPDDLLLQNLNWPLHPASGKPKVPSYFIALCNPDIKQHWLYRRFHPESLEWQQKYQDHYVMYQAATDSSLIDPEIIREALSRDPVWVERYYYGIWGITEGTIHRVTEENKLKVSPEWLKELVRKAALYRVLDHGDSSPTCCLWVAAYKGLHIVYREYYLGNELISTHRRNIADLSADEKYVGNYADPSIFNKTMQKYGGRWTVADEYSDSTICPAPTINWQPADNNEFSTRNRINELLRIHPDITHPVTNKVGAPRLYFIMKSSEHPYGCYHVTLQTESQKRKQIGSDNGKPVFVDDRDESVEDHAYDPLRYYVALHSMGSREIKPKLPENSFEDLRRKAIMRWRGNKLRQAGIYA